MHRKTQYIIASILGAASFIAGYYILIDELGYKVALSIFLIIASAKISLMLKEEDRKMQTKQMSLTETVSSVKTEENENILRALK